MASARHGTLYTGVTSHLIQRICQHRGGSFDGFTKRCGVKLLVWFEQAGTMHAAITRETRHKNWQRKWKIDLIEKANPDWRDLAEELGLPPLPSSSADETRGSFALIRVPCFGRCYGSRISSADDEVGETRRLCVFV